ncbi:MAG: efflux transporter outer membrane subunit [Rhodopila sp.]|nr:efflux transporter outer membrane subunit [Rhodopila sp.]
MLRKTFPAALALLLGGCTLIPDYSRPALPVANQWPAGPAYDNQGPEGAAKETGTPAAFIGWRTFFSDPVTADLIGLGLTNNRDLRIAVAQVDAMRAQFDVQHAGLFPTISAGGNMDRQREPAGLTRSPGAGPGEAVYTRGYGLGFGVSSYEVDLFGRIRSLSRSAFERYLSEDENRLGVQISLVANIATAYLTWLADRQALQITADTVANRQNAYRLIQLTMQRGTGTDEDVAQAEMALREAEANNQQYTRQVARDLNQLQQLVGAPIPAALQQRMLTVKSMEAADQFPPIPAGLPSDLLERRPDILAAEHTLLAANANIGAARAAFFPTLTLTASGGTESNSVANLFSAGTGAWSFAPQISVPIFDAGRNAANLDLAKARKRQEIATYEKVIQTAFHDVADALAGRGTYTDQLASQQGDVDASSRAYRISMMRFQSGSDNYLNALVAQRSLYDAQIQLVNVRLQDLSNLISLYKALGGGWTEHTKVEQAQQPGDAGRAPS